jgi:hypothetical protein
MMREGYIAGAKPRDLAPFLPGWKCLEFEEGNFHLVDMWNSSPNSRYSSGFTAIYWRDTLVWTMQYMGWYENEAIPTLKAALRKCYDESLFVGGRGPDEFIDGDLNYRNYPGHNTFASFRGWERIADNTGHIKGMHQYNGQWLIE